MNDMLILLLLSVFPVSLSVRCFSGMQGAVNGDLIGQIEVIECNSTEYCVKLPSYGVVGRKHYDGAQYGCDYGECRKNVCEKRENGELICCCTGDECNSANGFSIAQLFYQTTCSLLLTLLLLIS